MLPMVRPCTALVKTLQPRNGSDVDVERGCTVECKRDCVNCPDYMRKWHDEIKNVDRIFCKGCQHSPCKQCDQWHTNMVTDISLQMEIVHMVLRLISFDHFRITADNIEKIEVDWDNCRVKVDMSGNITILNINFDLLMFFYNRV